MNQKYTCAACVSVALLFTTVGIAQPPQSQNLPEQTANAPKRDTKHAVQLTENAKTLLDSWSNTPGDIVALEQAKSLLIQAQEADAQYAPSFLQTARFNLLSLYAVRATTDKNYADQAISISEMATNHALELDPKLVDAYVVLADIYQVKGDLEKATASLDKAEKLGCKSPWLEIQRAIVESRTSGASNQAVFKHLSSALKRAEQLKETRAIEAAAYGIGNYYQDQKQDQLAGPYFKKSALAHGQIATQAKAIASKL